MWELDHKGWALKNWCFLTVVLEKTLESTLDWKIKSVSPKLISHKISHNNPDYSLEGLMLKLKVPIVWSPDAKSLLIEKDPDTGKNWKKEEKGVTEDEI